uniref:Basigin n=1 Tax=Echinococcus granulosus TaxID=6210 RepID=A0A068WH91_ECHGR|nr:basigin [Echinococcus granulosus]
MGLLLQILTLLSISSLFGNAIKVESLKNVTLPTYTSNLQYEGIQFQKRAKNASIRITLNFTIIDLPCKDVKLSFRFNNKTIAVGNPGDRVEVFAEKHFDSAGMLTNLFIHLEAANSGIYVLTVEACADSESAEVLVLSAPILPVYSKPKRVLQGDPLRISCRVSSYPIPDSVQWLFASIPIDLSDDKAAISDASANLKPISPSNEAWEDVTFATEDGTLNDTLRFSAITVAQNGLFACNVSNVLGTDSTFLLVGVKDRWAALWPFIGIVVEVTVLVAAILLYERHQIRKKPAAPEATGNPDTASPNSNAVDKNPKPDESALGDRPVRFLPSCHSRSRSLIAFWCIINSLATSIYYTRSSLKLNFGTSMYFHSPASFSIHFYEYEKRELRL